jgi:Ubiquitin-conjugating enzyme
MRTQFPRFTPLSMAQVNIRGRFLNISALCHYRTQLPRKLFSAPEGTPFVGGCFRLKLVIPREYPNAPPRGFFLTKIYHPNVADNGDICVNTLKKDWTTEVTLKHIFQVIRCLLIVPFPESSLNCEAGDLIFLCIVGKYTVLNCLLTQMVFLISQVNFLWKVTKNSHVGHES